ncbi:MAG: DNA recombination protein RmuC, partial [Candidatus Latescibacteria bacterium]|nr:DNA recombination protein RmuC [Candidatus Latescibacterota bacterium]
FDSERKLHGRDLDTKKSLIDQQLQRMVSELDKVAGVVRDLEKDRENKFGELTKQIEETGKRTGELIRTTNTLNEALASSKSRGQWGERMAEDVLRIAGFVEKINYVKQATIEESGGRPDFTFLLPRGRKLNMDVKFPYDNYMRYIESESDSDREQFRRRFLRDVRLRIREVASREYIDPDGRKTVDYVLLFIPNEQIYSFINEQDAAILDDGIRSKVILCSPVTLFAVLAVIRAAVENFALERTSDRILDLLGKFGKQWGMFVESFDKLGHWIDRSQVEYANLLTTRKNQLERPLNKIEELRRRREIETGGSEDHEQAE